MPFKTKFAVPLALGFSIVTVTAFVVYYVFKKDEERFDKSVKTSKVNVIEVTVPKSIVPALIGRNGSNIKEIESKSGALIHFKKFSDKEYDVCIIRGRSSTTQLAETMIHDFIKQQPVLVTDYMEVPMWSVGKIIGHGGENINDISHMSGARIKIESTANGNDNEHRQISFRGSTEQIVHAKKIINNCIAQEKCRREVEQAKRPRLPQPLNPASLTNTATATPATPKTPVTPRPVTPDTGDAPKHVRYKRYEAAGSSIEVYVSAVSSPSRFWLQFVGPQVAQLDELVAHMTDFYNNKDNRTAHALSKVSVGQVVAAVFRHDGRWYRARVDDIRPNEFDSSQQVADVFYLDYGDSEYVATHELCELRADLLRLRFQAMECFLAGVKPVGETKPNDEAGCWPKWHPHAVERFEELTQVARWKPLLSRTCSYKRRSSLRGESDKEIPGIKLHDVNDEGSLDIGERLVSEGWALVSNSPSNSPPRSTNAPNTPFGDLYNSRVLGMLGPRAASMPKDHKDDRELSPDTTEPLKDNPTSKSLSGGLDSADKIKSISNFDLSYDTTTIPVNGSHEFVATERQHVDNEREISPTLKPIRDEFKANINRIDSHHSNLEALGREK